MRTSLGSRPFVADRTGLRGVRLYGDWNQVGAPLRGFGGRTTPEGRRLVGLLTRPSVGPVQLPVDCAQAPAVNATAATTIVPIIRLIIPPFLFQARLPKDRTRWPRAITLNQKPARFRCTSLPVIYGRKGWSASSISDVSAILRPGLPGTFRC